MTGLQKRKPAHSIALIFLLSVIFFAEGPGQAGPLEQKLMDAAFMGKVETARNLIGQDADVNAPGAQEETPLLSAARKELPE